MNTYLVSQAFDAEARLLVTKKFPGCLDGLMCPVIRSLPTSLTARGAFDYIKHKVVQASTTPGNLGHKELLQALIMREYKPG